MTDSSDPPTLPPGIIPVRTSTGLEYFDVAAGTGRAARDGDRVRAVYRVWLLDGRLADDTVGRGGSHRFTIGRGDTIAALEEGARGMRAGGKRRLIVPSDLAHGPSGDGGAIPPYATLIIDLEILAIS